MVIVHANPPVPHSAGHAVSPGGSNRWFESLVLGCLRRTAPAHEFLNALQISHVEALQHLNPSHSSTNGEAAVNGVNGTGTTPVNLQEVLTSKAKSIVLIAAHLYAPVSPETAKLPLTYLDVLLSHVLITHSTYCAALTSFDNFTPEQLPVLAAVIERLVKAAGEVHCSYSNDAECLQLCQLLSATLMWLLGGVEAVLLKPGADAQPSIDRSREVLDVLYHGAQRLHESQFARVCLYIRLSAATSGEELTTRLETITRTCERISAEAGTNGNSLLSTVQRVLELFSLFSQPPDFEWRQHAREDYIRHECRPTVLSICAIFATCRSLRSTANQAQSLATVAAVTGISGEKLVFDLVRAGLLIQMEAEEDCAGDSQQRGGGAMREREPLADMFTYLRVPQIVRKLVEKEGIARSDVYKALERISRQHSLLNEIDSRKHDNTLVHLATELKQCGILDGTQLQQLADSRLAGLERKPELRKLLMSDGEASAGCIGDGATEGGEERHEEKAVTRPTSHLSLLKSAQQAKKNFERSFTVTDNKRWIPMITRLLHVPSNVDLLCAASCADGNLTQLSAKLATINSQAEKAPGSPSLIDPDEGKNRILMFDSTFLLLSRINYVYVDMRLDELVGGDAQKKAKFYEWTELYSKHVHGGVPMAARDRDAPSEPNRTDFLAHHLPRLRSGCKYWDESWDFGRLIDNTRFVGEWLLEEATKPEFDEKELHAVLTALRGMSCLLLTLVQWLEIQHHPARQIIAKIIMEWANGLVRPTDQQQEVVHNRLAFAMVVADAALREMLEPRRQQRELAYTWVISYAQRDLPAVSYHSPVPDLPMLKEAFLYAMKVGWATPDVVAHINRCNHAIKYWWCKPATKKPCFAKPPVRLCAVYLRDLFAFFPRRSVERLREVSVRLNNAVVCCPPRRLPQHSRDGLCVMVKAGEAMDEHDHYRGTGFLARDEHEPKMANAWHLASEFEDCCSELKSAAEKLVGQHLFPARPADDGVRLIVITRNRPNDIPYALRVQNLLTERTAFPALHFLAHHLHSRHFYECVCLLVRPSPTPMDETGPAVGLNGELLALLPASHRRCGASDGRLLRARHLSFGRQLPSMARFIDAVEESRGLVRATSFSLHCGSRLGPQGDADFLRQLLSTIATEGRDRLKQEKIKYLLVLTNAQAHATIIDAFVKCWLKQMLKLCTADEMEMAAELCVAVSLTRPVMCLLEMIQPIIDSVFYKHEGQGQPAACDVINIAINKTAATVVAQMLVRLMTLLLWAEDCRLEQERQKAERRQQQQAARKRRFVPPLVAAIDRQAGAHHRDETDDDPMGEDGRVGSVEEVLAPDAPSPQPPTTSSTESSVGPQWRSRSGCGVSGETVENTIKCVFARFEEALEGARLRPPATFIFLFMHELCVAPKTSYWRRLVEAIPTRLFFTLARLDSACIPLAAFLQLYTLGSSHNDNEAGNETRRMTVLRYACMMRKFGRI